MPSVSRTQSGQSTHASPPLSRIQSTLVSPPLSRHQSEYSNASSVGSSAACSSLFRKSSGKTSFSSGLSKKRMTPSSNRREDIFDLDSVFSEEEEEEGSEDSKQEKLTRAPSSLMELVLSRNRIKRPSPIDSPLRRNKGCHVPKHESISDLDSVATNGSMSSKFSVSHSEVKLGARATKLRRKEKRGGRRKKKKSHRRGGSEGNEDERKKTRRWRRRKTRTQEREREKEGSPEHLQEDGVHSKDRRRSMRQKRRKKRKKKKAEEKQAKKQELARRIGSSSSLPPPDVVRDVALQWPEDANRSLSDYEGTVLYREIMRQDEEEAKRAEKEELEAECASTLRRCFSSDFGELEGWRVQDSPPPPLLSRSLSFSYTPSKPMQEYGQDYISEAPEIFDWEVNGLLEFVNDAPATGAGVEPTAKKSMRREPLEEQPRRRPRQRKKARESKRSHLIVFFARSKADAAASAPKRFRKRHKKKKMKQLKGDNKDGGDSTQIGSANEMKQGYGDEDSDDDDDSPSSDEDGVHEFSESRADSWKVHKINKRGKRQLRFLVIDAKAERVRNMTKKGVCQSEFRLDLLRTATYDPNAQDINLREARIVFLHFTNPRKRPFELHFEYADVMQNFLKALGSACGRDLAGAARDELRNRGTAGEAAACDPYTFKVVKTNRRGKRQNRVLKYDLVAQSLRNLDPSSGSVEKVFAFAEITGVTILNAKSGECVMYFSTRNQSPYHIDFVYPDRAPNFFSLFSFAVGAPITRSAGSETDAKSGRSITRSKLSIRRNLSIDGKRSSILTPPGLTRTTSLIGPQFSPRSLSPMSGSPTGSPRGSPRRSLHAFSRRSSSPRSMRAASPRAARVLPRRGSALLERAGAGYSTNLTQRSPRAPGMEERKSRRASLKTAKYWGGAVAAPARKAQDSGRMSTNSPGQTSSRDSPTDGKKKKEKKKIAFPPRLRPKVKSGSMMDLFSKKSEMKAAKRSHRGRSSFLNALKEFRSISRKTKIETIDELQRVQMRDKNIFRFDVEKRDKIGRYVPRTLVFDKNSGMFRTEDCVTGETRKSFLIKDIREVRLNLAANSAKIIFHNKSQRPYELCFSKGERHLRRFGRLARGLLGESGLKEDVLDLRRQGSKSHEFLITKMNKFGRFVERLLVVNEKTGSFSNCNAITRGVKREFAKGEIKGVNFKFSDLEVRLKFKEKSQRTYFLRFEDFNEMTRFLDVARSVVGARSVVQVEGDTNSEAQLLADSLSETYSFKVKKGNKYGVLQAREVIIDFSSQTFNNYNSAGRLKSYCDFVDIKLVRRRFNSLASDFRIHLYFEDSTLYDFKLKTQVEAMEMANQLHRAMKAVAGQSKKGARGPRKQDGGKEITASAERLEPISEIKTENSAGSSPPTARKSGTNFMGMRRSGLQRFTVRKGNKYGALQNREIVLDFQSSILENFNSKGRLKSYCYFHDLRLVRRKFQPKRQNFRIHVYFLDGSVYDLKFETRDEAVEFGEQLHVAMAQVKGQPSKGRGGPIKNVTAEKNESRKSLPSISLLGIGDEGEGDLEEEEEEEEAKGSTSAPIQNKAIPLFQV